MALATEDSTDATSPYMSASPEEVCSPTSNYPSPLPVPPVSTVEEEDFFSTDTIHIGEPDPEFVDS